MAYYERKERNYNSNKRNPYGQKKNSYSDSERKTKKTYERINYKMIEIPMGSSDYYNENISQLFDILVSIPYDKIKLKVSIPVSNDGNHNLKPNYVHTGWIKEFDPAKMSFKVSVPESVTDLFPDTCVIIPNVIKTKDRDGENIQAITGQFYINYKAEKYGVMIDESSDETAEEVTSETTE